MVLLLSPEQATSSTAVTPQRPAPTLHEPCLDEHFLGEREEGWGIFSSCYPFLLPQHLLTRWMTWSVILFHVHLSISVKLYFCHLSESHSHDVTPIDWIQMNKCRPPMF